MMIKTVLGYSALFSLIAVICTHPIRNTANGPRLISLLLFWGLVSLGAYVVLDVADFYAKGLAPVFSRGGGVLVIAAHPVKAYFFIGVHLAFSAACLWAAMFFMRVAMLRKNKKTSQS